jgi:hypothetical protein
MSEHGCTFCKIAGRGYESEIAYEQEGVIAFKYINGRGLVQQRLRPGQEGLTTCTRTRGENVGMGIPWV